MTGTPDVGSFYHSKVSEITPDIILDFVSEPGDRKYFQNKEPKALMFTLAMKLKPS